MKPGLVAAMVIALLTMGFARAAPLPTVAGFWESDDDKGNPQAWFLFAEKDGFWEGRLVKGFRKPGEKIVEICTKCTGDQKNAHIMGITIVNGMKRYGLKYKDGSILDPRDGSVYHAEMELSPDGKDLGVRGYIGIPLLGQTQTWHKLPDDAIPEVEIPKEILATPATAAKP